MHRRVQLLRKPSSLALGIFLQQCPIVQSMFSVYSGSSNLTELTLLHRYRIAIQEFFGWCFEQLTELARI
jgi:hypothetical protein